MTRAELEAYALELGWVIDNRDRRDALSFTRFTRDAATISVSFDHDGDAVAGVCQSPDCNHMTLTDVEVWVRKRLRELAGRYTPPASLLDTVAMAVDDDHPDLADLPTVEGER